MKRSIVYTLLLITYLFEFGSLYAQKIPDFKKADKAITGDQRLDEYLPLLKKKKVAILVNQTSLAGKTHLLDTLLSRDVNVVKIFVPEHGFRGASEAGETVDNTVDKKTGISVISLYGNNKKPSKEDLKGVDILLYDLQDVGVRFYTYISTLQYAMEACAEYNKPLIVLDRPNPNGHYIDGPVLDTTLRSFVGMQPIPIVYAMTAGEYAQMLKGEEWFPGANDLKLTVINCLNYDHTMLYELPVQPSPNLKTMAAIYSYPSMCLFEGTVTSVGRGTDNPFQQFGHPDFFGKPIYDFTPMQKFGQPEPLYANRKCYGQLVALNEQEALYFFNKKMRLIFLQRAYGWYPYKEKFFNSFFEKLAGTKELREQIINKVGEEEIRNSWKEGIADFKVKRKKYLLYTDFE